MSVLTCPNSKCRALAERVLRRRGDARELPPVGEPCKGCKAKAARAAAGPKEPRKRRVTVPCVHIGRDLLGRERAERGLDSRRWTLCLHPEQPLGEAVCGCRGCGPRCRGYSAAALENP